MKICSETFKGVMQIQSDWSVSHRSPWSLRWADTQNLRHRVGKRNYKDPSGFMMLWESMSRRESDISAFERWFCRNDVTWWSYDHFCKNVHHALARYWVRRAKSFSKIRWTMLTIWQESHPNHTSDSFRITPGAGVSSSCASTKLSGPKESQHVWHRSLVQSTDIYSYG